MAKYLYIPNITEVCRSLFEEVQRGNLLYKSPYADRIPTIAKVWGWHGGAAPTEYELLQVGAIPRGCPAWLAARDSSSAFCVTSVV